MLLRPTLTVAAVHEVTPALLGSYRVKAVMVDLDDTLVASDADVLDPRFKTWVRSLQAAGIPLLILSNGTAARVTKWSQELGVAGFALVGKPWLYAFKKGLKLLGKEARETAMIGDQLFTDVLGANLAGMTSILVKPLSAGKLPHTRLLRRLERYFLKGY